MDTEYEPKEHPSGLSSVQVQTQTTNMRPATGAAV
jgi:hypothetical protein